MNFDDDNVGRLLLKFSIPAITGMLVNALYNIVDRIFISYGVGSMAFSGLTLTGPLMNVILAFSMLIGIGGATRISIKLGEGNRETAEKILGNSAALLVIIGVTVSVLGIIFLKPILILFGGSENTLSYATEYMTIIFAGNTFSTVAFGLVHMTRASGRPNDAMLSMLVGAITNTILDPLFIFVFKWGVRGAALATIISQFVSMMFIIWVFVRPKNTMLRFQRKSFRIELGIFLQIASIGLSPFLTQSAMAGVSAITNHALKVHGGDLAIGAMGIVTTVGMLFLMPIFGLNQGSQPIVGYNYGARRYDRVKHTLKITLTTATIICIVGWVLFEFAPGLVIRAFTPDKQLTDITVHGIRVANGVFFVLGAQVIGVTFFQSIGQAKKSILLSMSRQVIFLIPLLLILPNIYGLNGIWFSILTADILSITLTVSMLIYTLRTKFNTEACAETV